MASKKPQLDQSETVEELPIACASEAAAVDFLERKRWGNSPCCPLCGCVGNVYKMTDRTTGERSKRFLWRCRDCSKQFTVRTGTVFAESLIPLHKWCRAYWEACSGKNGVSALEISRKLQVSYKSALFMMHRIRFGMAENFNGAPKMTGTLEADETFIGGKVRMPNGLKHFPTVSEGIKASQAKKTPLLAIVQRKGIVRARVIPSVTAENVIPMIRENADKAATLYTDGGTVYTHRDVKAPVAKHKTVAHHRGEYVKKTDKDCHTNTVENFFGRVKRSLTGVYHNVSKEHLHRYVDQWAFAHNTRGMNDGERTVFAIQQAQGKRLRRKSA